jgi:hypothetical protein
MTTTANGSQTVVAAPAAGGAAAPVAPAAAPAVVPLLTLPCNATGTEVNGMTYYQCSQQYYVMAYGGAGPIYIPVGPPDTAAAPAQPAPASAPKAGSAG